MAEVAMPANLRIRKLPYKPGGLISPFLSLPILIEYAQSWRIYIIYLLHGINVVVFNIWQEI